MGFNLRLKLMVSSIFLCGVLLTIPCDAVAQSNPSQRVQRIENALNDMYDSIVAAISRIKIPEIPEQLQLFFERVSNPLDHAQGTIKHIGEAADLVESYQGKMEIAHNGLKMLGMEGEEHKEEADRKRADWEIKYDEALKEYNQVQAMVNSAMALDHPDPCSALQLEIDQRKEKLRDAFRMYKDSNLDVRDNAYYAMNAWKLKFVAYGIFVSQTLETWANGVGIISAVTGFVKGIKTTAKVLFQTGLRVKDLIVKSKNLFSSYLHNHFSGKSLVQGLKESISSLKTTLSSLFSSLLGQIKTIGRFIANLFSELLQAIKNIDWDKVRALAQSIRAQLAEANGVRNVAANAYARAKATIKDLTKRAWDGAKKFDEATKDYQDANDTLTDALDLVTNLGEDAGKGKEDADGKLMTTIKWADEMFLGVEKYRTESANLERDVPRIIQAELAFQSGLEFAAKFKAQIEGHIAALNELIATTCEWREEWECLSDNERALYSNCYRNGTLDDHIFISTETAAEDSCSTITCVEGEFVYEKREFILETRTVISSSTRGIINDTGWLTSGSIDCTDPVPGCESSSYTIPGNSLGVNDETITTTTCYRKSW